MGINGNFSSKTFVIRLPVLLVHGSMSLFACTKVRIARFLMGI